MGRPSGCERSDCDSGPLCSSMAPNRNALADSGQLRTLFRLEAFRSWRIDVDDDLSGNTCTQGTLSKARILVDIASRDYQFLKHHDGLFFGEEALSERALVTKYEERLRCVHAQFPTSKATKEH